MESSRMSNFDPIYAARRSVTPDHAAPKTRPARASVAVGYASISIATSLLSIAGSLQQIAAALRKGDSA